MLHDLAEAHPSVGAVRNIGLFGAIEIVSDKETKEPISPNNGLSSEMTEFKEACLRDGLFIYAHSHTVLIIPPLIIDKDKLITSMEILDKALAITDQLVH